MKIILLVLGAFLLGFYFSIYIFQLIPLLVTNESSVTQWLTALEVLLVAIFAVYIAAKSNLLKNKFIEQFLSILVNHTFAVACIVLIVGAFLPGDIPKLAAFTYSSVTLGFWFTDVRRKEDDERQEEIRKEEEINRKEEKRRENRRIEGFYLGAIWNELRFNRHRLEEIKSNFKFKVDSPEMMSATFERYSNVHKTTKSLKTIIYEALYSSGNITKISSDDVFNAIETAYADIRHAQVAADTILINFEQNVSFLQGLNTPVFINAILLRIQNNIQYVAREVAIAYRSVDNAVNIADKHLSTLGINMEEAALRNSTLNESDERFIKNSVTYPTLNEVVKEIEETIKKS